MNITKTTSTTFCANLQQTNSDTNRLTVRTWLHLMQLTWHQTKSWSILLMRERERKKIKWAREDNRKSQLNGTSLAESRREKNWGLKGERRDLGIDVRLKGWGWVCFLAAEEIKSAVCLPLSKLKLPTFYLTLQMHAFRLYLY